ncbi:NAD(P)H-hydrate epimerase [Nesterenkonia sp. PF2B19]|nr:NAD(P)H-hydrate epimerase [Nesterenkonia sp. PF2B19]
MGAPSCIPLIPLYTGRQIRQAEAPLLEAGHRETLMRRAAYGLAQAVLERLRAVRGSVYGAKVTGLIGSGNNGGDGLYALAMLRRRGVETHAVMMRDRAHEAGTRAFLAAGGRLVDVVDTDTDALIDAIIGTGSRVGFEMPRIPGLDEVLADESTQVIACDIPSGVDVETGAVAGDVIDADVTVTFGGIKSGLALGEGSHAAGEIRAVDIGLGATLPTPARWLVGRRAAAGDHAGCGRHAGPVEPAAGLGARSQVLPRRAACDRRLGAVPRGGAADRDSGGDLRRRHGHPAGPGGGPGTPEHHDAGGGDHLREVHRRAGAGDGGGHRPRHLP